MAKEKQYYGDVILTTKFRAAFINVFEPDDNGKYSITMLFKKGDPFIAELKKAMNTLVNSYFEGQQKPSLKNPIKDGDIPNGNGNIMNGFAGHMVISAKNKSQPKVRDKTNTLNLTEQSDFYAGCYARGQITAFIYNHAGKRGVSFFLGHLQFMEDGEPLGNFTKAEDVFDAIQSSEDPAAYEGDDAFADPTAAKAPEDAFTI